MGLSKETSKNIIFLILIAVLLIPQTRKPIQVLIHRGLLLISNPSVLEDNETTKLTDYHWELIDQEEQHYNFNNAKKRVVLVNFWATWCPPCIAEMPSLQKLYDDYKDKADFLFVTSDSKDEITSFLEKHNYSFKVYRPISGYPKYFNVTSIPRTYLIDKEGTVVMDEENAADWNSKRVRNFIDGLLTK